jgi:hypothetical protein
MQNLFWKAYFIYAVICAYYVESLKAALRHYYRDQHILPKCMALYGLGLMSLFFVSPVLWPGWKLPVAIYVTLGFVLIPYFLLVSIASQWDRSKDYNKTSRRNAEWLKAWSQSP